MIGRKESPTVQIKRVNRKCNDKGRGTQGRSEASINQSEQNQITDYKKKGRICGEKQKNRGCHFDRLYAALDFFGLYDACIHDAGINHV